MVLGFHIYIIRAIVLINVVVNQKSYLFKTDCYEPISDSLCLRKFSSHFINDWCADIGVQ